jgi:hypothetical protein
MLPVKGAPYGRVPPLRSGHTLDSELPGKNRHLSGGRGRSGRSPLVRSVAGYSKPVSVAIRDSTDPQGAVSVMSREEWQSLIITWVRLHRYDCYMDKAEDIRKLLNFSGYPFQHYCGDKLAKLDNFQVAAEVPFTYPRTNGSLLGVSGAIDLLAACPSVDNSLLMFFVVECKKANDKIKNWILLPNKLQDPRWPIFCFSQQESGMPMQMAVTRSVTFPSLGYARSTEFDFCINGIEADTRLANTNRDQSEKVYNPLKQAMHGTVAFESSFPKVVEGIEYLRHGGYATHLYLPVILTTANIYIADIPADQVAQGEISPGMLSLSEPKKWVTVEFPLPDYLSYETDREGGRIRFFKRTVFIVNDQSIDEFFTGVLDVATFRTIPVRE